MFEWLECFSNKCTTHEWFFCVFFFEFFFFFFRQIDFAERSVCVCVCVCLYRMWATVRLVKQTEAAAHVVEVHVGDAVVHAKATTPTAQPPATTTHHNKMAPTRTRRRVAVATVRAGPNLRQPSLLPALPTGRSTTSTSYSSSTTAMHNASPAPFSTAKKVIRANRFKWLPRKRYVTLVFVSLHFCFFAIWHCFQWSFSKRRKEKKKWKFWKKKKNIFCFFFVLFFVREMCEIFFFYIKHNSF